MFETKRISPTPDVTAPDGSDVRLLLSLKGGSMAQFELAPGRVSRAAVHKTVEEIWYFIAGKGQMWRKLGVQEEVVDVQTGVCITIPVGTHFQFRSMGEEPLMAVAITMPPWPGDEEASFVQGIW
jgi:mannose-6-phosphate isomerase-like protein (cupin superfamily)